MNQEELKKVVREVISQAMAKKTGASAAAEKPPVYASQAKENIARWLTGGENSPSRNENLPPVASAPAASEIKSESHIPKPRKPEKLDDWLKKTPARIGVWRAGTRYLTRIALKFRADHAVAKDAVYAELPKDFASKNGWVELQSKAKDKEEYLLRPDLGRQLNEESMRQVLEKGAKNPDVQIIVADGLSPWAAERHSKAMVDEMLTLFKTEGKTVGTVFCVRYSRIAIQDVIGEALGAKVSMIILGERPGLGGGDSLSNYMIYNPKVGAVNALKSMISNIHPSGHAPKEAARLTVHMVKKMFEQNCSGIELKV